MVGPLSGFTVGITGDRRADEQAELLRRRGARVVHGPMIETRPLADGPQLRGACDELVARPPHILVATTGVGMRSWMEAADGMGVGDDLRSSLVGTEILARSPKAAGAAVTVGLDVDWKAAGERSVDVLDHLSRRDLGGVRVAVQRDGADEPSLARALTATGATVIDVPVYRWHLPSDTGPAHRLLDAVADRRLDALTVTSSPALSNLFALADGRDDAAAVRAGLSHDDLVIACVGPVCTESARRLGLDNTVQPERFRLGAMVRTLADALSGRAWRWPSSSAELWVQGGLAVVDGEAVVLPRREQQLLARLAQAAGAVVPKADLARAVWGPEADPHLVEVTVGRLRQRLGRAGDVIVTVPRRGYRLAGPPQPA